MRRLATLIAITLVAFLLASACRNGGEEGEPSPSPTPTEGPTPTSGEGGGTLGEIQTPSGLYSITKVEAGDRFPINCLELEFVSCQIAPRPCSTCDLTLEEGEQVVAVVLKELLDYEMGAGSRPLHKSCLDDDTVYIISDDGSRGDCEQFLISSDGINPLKTHLVFTLPTSAKWFTLFVPDNPPIDLGK